MLFYVAGPKLEAFSTCCQPEQTLSCFTAPTLSPRASHQTDTHTRTHTHHTHPHTNADLCIYIFIFTLKKYIFMCRCTIMWT